MPLTDRNNDIVTYSIPQSIIAFYELRIGLLKQFGQGSQILYHARHRFDTQWPEILGILELENDLKLYVILEHMLKKHRVDF